MNGWDGRDWLWLGKSVFLVAFWVAALCMAAGCIPTTMTDGHAKVKGSGWGITVEEERDLRGPDALDQVKAARELDEEKREWQADDTDDLLDQLDDLHDRYDPVPNGLAESHPGTVQYCVALNVTTATLESDALEDIDRLHVKPLKDLYCQTPRPAVEAAPSHSPAASAPGGDSCPVADPCPECPDCSAMQAEIDDLRERLSDARKRSDAQAEHLCPGYLKGQMVLEGSDITRKVAQNVNTDHALLAALERLCP